MAYVSATEGGSGVGASVIHPDSSHSEYISVPDAELLFRGDFHRAGPDLVLTGHDGHHHIIPGYFSSENHPALMGPSGATLSPGLVELLAGSPAPGQYAQAQPTAHDSVGKVEKVVGDVSVMRNGVSVALHIGDAVYKSDVIQTGANSSAGIGFPDGTALNLSAGTRMALNEYSFEPNASTNAALFSLVEGTFAFVAGQVAHTGDMKIETPVATMGIRGTAGIVRHEFQGHDRRRGLFVPCARRDRYPSPRHSPNRPLPSHRQQAGLADVRRAPLVRDGFGIRDLHRGARPRLGPDRQDRGDTGFNAV